MVFSSVIFLFLFLPIVLFVHSLLYKKNIWISNLLLFIFSSLFYIWGEQEMIIVMYACILVNYFAGLCMSWDFHNEKLKFLWRKIILLCSIGVSIGLLVYFKYTNFFTNIWNSFFVYIQAENFVISDFKTIALPLGISFYTFHALSYTFDVYNKKLKTEKNLINFAAYVVMFPQLVAGPIVRYRDIHTQFYHRVITRTGFANGIRRFIIGLSKKVLIANTVAKVADDIFSLPVDQISTPVAWIGVIAYTLQIYFDFSGYSDMAIGLGMMFGFRYKENFMYPYISQSIQEFWRRWHISLSSWLKDYVYIPLGGSKKGIKRTYLNLLIVFFLCGLWHGANWTFIVWGLWYGAFLIIERLGLKSILEKVNRPIRHLYVLLVVMIGWVFFRSESLPNALLYIKIMFGIGDFGGNSRNIMAYLQNDFILAVILGCIASTNIVKVFRGIVQKNAKSGSDIHYTFVLYKGLIMVMSIVLLVVSLMSVANGYYNPFIYFRF